MTEELKNLSISDVERYVANYANRKGVRDNEELLSLALYYLAKAIDKESIVNPDNPRAYEMSWIVGCCKNFSMNIVNTVELKEDMLVGFIDTTNEIIEDLKLTQKEQVILEMRLEGYEDNEIGVFFGESHQNISYHRNKIKEKYRCMSRE